MMKQWVNRLVVLAMLCAWLPATTALAAEQNFLNSALSDQTPAAFDEGIPVTSPTNAANQLKPYGYNLFSGTFTTRKPTELDPNYQVVAGDRISVRIQGQQTLNEVLTVDANGKVYIPDVGEVPMVGVRAADVSARIDRGVRSAYKPGTPLEVYANLLTSTARSVSVFVTGSVLRPGQYIGLPDDSALAYLHQAGGIDPDRGSYRYVLVKRGQQRLAVIDLYDFLNNGNLPRIQFRDGDTIVVRPQGNMINVEGATRHNYRFEFLGSALNGAQLIRYARPESNVTNVALSGTRNGLPLSSYLSYEQFLRTRLLDGDTVRFVSDASSPVIDVSVEGSHLGNSYFAVKTGSRLQEVLDYISVDPNDADIGNIYIKRKSVAIDQKRNIDAALRRLERSVLTAPAESSGEANIRVKEAELVLKFVERAGRVQPEGRVVVSDRGKIANIRLEDGDIIVIPQKSDVITVSGEVNVPQALVYAGNARVYDYIAQAGGFTDRANRDRLVIMKPNGKVMMGENLRVEPGDEITVYPKVDTKDRQVTLDIVQIIYQIAVAAKAVGL